MYITYIYMYIIYVYIYLHLCKNEYRLSTKQNRKTRNEKTMRHLSPCSCTWLDTTFYGKRTHSSPAREHILRRIPEPVPMQMTWTTPLRRCSLFFFVCPSVFLATVRGCIARDRYGQRANYLQGKIFEFSVQKLSNLLSFAL